MAGPLRYLARIGKRLRSNAGVALVSVLAGAASINVACKGFELLLYDSDDLEDPRPSLPRAVYVSGSRGCRDLRDRDRRRADARPRSADRRQRGSVACGRRPTRLSVPPAGGSPSPRYCTPRRRRSTQLSSRPPAWCGISYRSGASGAPRSRPRRPPGDCDIGAHTDRSRARDGARCYAGPRLASVTFLVVFALVNYLHAWSTDVRLERWLGRLGGSACALTIGVLLARLAAADRAVLVLVLPCFASVGALRREVHPPSAVDRDSTPGNADDVITTSYRTA